MILEARMRRPPPQHLEKCSSCVITKLGLLEEGRPFVLFHLYSYFIPNVGNSNTSRVLVSPFVLCPSRNTHNSGRYIYLYQKGINALGCCPELGLGFAALRRRCGPRNKAALVALCCCSCCCCCCCRRASLWPPPCTKERLEGTPFLPCSTLCLPPGGPCVRVSRGVLQRSENKVAIIFIGLQCCDVNSRWCYNYNVYI